MTITRIIIIISVTICIYGCATIPKNNTSLPAPSKSGAFDIGGTIMYYEIFGQGQPVLFIHAGIADSRMWDEQVGPLSLQYMIIRYDLRGFGRTPRGTVRFSHYHDIAVLLDSLRIGNVHVVGASFGGRVAIDFALAFPQRARSLTLCAPAISGAIPSSEMLNIDSTEKALLKKGDQKGAAEFEVRTWVIGPNRQPNEVSLALQKKVAEMQLHNYSIPSPISAESVPLEPRAITQLENIHIPTLVLVGDKDVQSFQNLSEIITNRILNAKRIVIPNVAHMISMERPDTFNQILIDFISDK
jgi:3-oxoadipate enol-lactonase